MLDIKIYTLLTVYKTRNFTQAAKQLSLTQPAVSHHINQLEKELDVKIFNRSTNDLKPTIEGEIVIMYAKRISSLYSKLQEELINSKNKITQITIGITHTAESNFIIQVLAKYCSLNEGINIKIITDPIKKLHNKLMNYEIDLAIVEGSVNNFNINSLLLDTDYLVLAVSNDNILAKKNVITINQLKKEKMILRLPGSGTRNLFISHLESLNMSIMDFNLILEVDNVATIKDLVAQNFGVSILPKSVCLDYVRRKKLTILTIENLSMIRETNILYHKDFTHMNVLQDITKLYNKITKTYK